MISIVTSTEIVSYLQKQKCGSNENIRHGPDGIVVTCLSWPTAVSAVCNALTTPCFISQS